MGRVVATDFRGVVIDLNQLGRRNGQRVAVDPGAGGAVIKAAAECEQDIGVARRFVGGIRTVTADRPERQFARLVDGALAVRAGDDRYAQQFEEFEQNFSGFTNEAALTNEDGGTLGGQQEIKCLIERFEVTRRTLPDQGIGIGNHHISGFLKDVQRYVDIDRTGTTGA